MSEKTKKRSTSLFLIILFLSLIYYVSTAFIFHATEPKTAKYYDEEWFLDSPVKRPPLPFTNVSLPYNLTPNWTNFYLFEVEGKVPRLAWRMYVLSVYQEGYGWVANESQVANYDLSPPSGAKAYTVRTVILPIDYLNGTPLITLWDPTHNTVFCSAFNIYETSLAEVNVVPKIVYPDSMVHVELSSYRQGVVGVEYKTYDTGFDYGAVAHDSATINTTRYRAENDPMIKPYLKLPEEYFSRYPEVDELVRNVSLGDTATVYEQVTYVIGYLLSNYNFTLLDVTRDPVADFVSNNGGPLTGFINTTALILRAIGIPSRVVIGFVGGYYNATLGSTFMILSQHVAHWIEVWDANLGWVPYLFSSELADIYKIYSLLADLGSYEMITALPRPVENAVNWFNSTLMAPHKISGYDVAYLNESINITIEFIGNFESFRGELVQLFDYNESIRIGALTPIASANIEEVSANRYAVTFTVSYSEVYDSLGGEPLFGRHILILKVGSLATMLEFFLLRTTTFT